MDIGKGFSNTIENMSSHENVVKGFMEAITTINSRESFYNSKDSRMAYLANVHEKMQNEDPELYQLFLFYPGINDFNKLNIMGNILATKGMPAILESHEIHHSFYEILRDMGYARSLRFIDQLAERRINNKRTKKLILRFLFSDNLLPKRCLEYKSKIARGLTHAWGQKRTQAILKSIENENNEDLLSREIFKYSGSNSGYPLECVRFVFNRHPSKYKNEKFNAYIESKDDLTAGKGLPYRTLLGIRNNHHASESLAKVHNLSVKSLKDKATNTNNTGERLNGAELFRLSREEIYRYLYATGYESNEKTILSFNEGTKLELGRVNIVIDNSGSMAGKEGTKNHSISSALSLRDYLRSSASECKVFYTNETDDQFLPKVEGSSGYADAICDAAEGNPDYLIIIGDGYENSPAGLSQEVIKEIKNIRPTINFLQINPVFAVESGGVKSLSIPTVAAQKPEDLIASIVQRKIEGNPDYLKDYLRDQSRPYFKLSQSGEMNTFKLEELL